MKYEIEVLCWAGLIVLAFIGYAGLFIAVT